MGQRNAQVSATEGSEQAGRLDSWKEIAVYLRREVKTVQRWERELDLPVHRLFHTQRARVFAYTRELDAWSASRSSDRSPTGPEKTNVVGLEKHAGAWRDQTRHYVPWALAVLMVVAVAYWIGSRGEAELDATIAGTLVATPFTSSPGPEDQPVISPDGRQIAFAAADSPMANEDIYVQLIGTHTPLRLTDSPERDHSPTWSPDGNQITFLRHAATTNASTVLSVPALGGTEKVITEVSVIAPGLSWSPDGKMLAIVDTEGSAATAPSIFLFSPSDGSKRRLSRPEVGADDYFPKFDPSGQRVAYLRTKSNRTAVHVESLQGGEPQIFPVEARGIAWTEDGEDLVFSAPDLEGGGTLHRIHLADGQVERLGLGGAHTMWPDVRGGRLAYTRRTLTSNIWSLPLRPDGEASRGVAVRIIESTRKQYAPDFSPDGEWIVFASDRTGYRELWVSDRKGGQTSMLTEFNGAAVGSPRWSPDGKVIAFDSNAEGSVDIYTVPATGGAPQRLTTTSSSDLIPAWSHNGKWLYFVSDRSGQRQLWKIPAEGGDAVQVTQEGAFECRASSDGRYLYYAADQEEEIRRLRLSDGAEEVIPELAGIGRIRRYWTLSKDGIYFIREREEAGSVSWVEFYRFSDGKISAVAEIDRPVFDSSAGLAVSPDGRTLLYVLKEQDERDIMLVQNFK